MTMRAELPVWRSLLFVPITVEKFVAKAPSAGADGLILDLEDSVPLAEKARARTLVRETAAALSGSGDVLVRINRPWRMAVRDIEASVCREVTALACPKIADAGHVRALAEVLDEVEAEQGLPVGHTRIYAMIETVEALPEMRAIAAAHPRVVALSLGSEDFALSAGMQPEPDGLYPPTLAVVFAARAAGVLPMGALGSIAQYKDVPAYRADIERSRRLGFRGAAAIHPNQVSVLNAVHAPDPEEVADARGMIAAYEDAIARGLGAIEYGGKMIDVPVVARAKELVALADRIAGRGGDATIS